MKTYFSADTHFGHSRIIDYTGRPFGNVELMNEALIKNWNSRISKGDIVIFLGDFIFKQKEKARYFIDRLNGNITFIRGNHDNNNSLDTKILYVVVKFANQEVFCVHHPEDYSSSYIINLVGHVHEKWKIRKVYNSFLVNVGVDAWRYYPVNIEEILKAIVEFKRESKKVR